MTRKLLIANRGEIAVRIIRTANVLGIRTVAVYSDSDAEALHTKLADESVRIGPPEPAASYLNVDNVLDAAKSSGADTIHPGYGFLSENPEFADACEMAGLTFVGPPVEAMKKLGSKIDAKKLAIVNGIPVVPGYFELGADVATLKEEAKKVGYPVMLKASAGGGGRGMRVVRHEMDFDSEFRIASDEAVNAFGDGSMMIEKLIERPRHIEVQVLADKHGNVAALFERECSIQRRHQKLIEESPSVVCSGPAAANPSKKASRAPTKEAPTSGLWSKMREAAVALIKAAGYQGAGTVEFMLDQSSGKFYFLEVNARLQVEHPVTEMITGLDLVEWQLRIASGEAIVMSPLFLDGGRSGIQGHAIEARIVAEDPCQHFLPSSGTILGWAEPRGPGIRVDTGFQAGAEVPRHYDSLLAKVIAHGETRDLAIARLECALLDFHILGVKTNIAYAIEILRHPLFRKGEMDTGFLEREFADWKPTPDLPEALGAILSAESQPHAEGQFATAGSPLPNRSAWDASDDFRN